MWILLIATLAVMSALTALQTPREWFRRKVPRVLITLGYAVGMASVVLVLFAVCRMQDGPLREGIIWVETFHVTLTMYTLVLSAFRYFAFELARHFQHRKILQVLGSRTVFFLAAVVVTVAYLIPAVHNATTLRTSGYEIAVDKPCATDTLTVAAVSDFHIGAGARHRELDRMAELLKAAQPDLVLIAGDICDSSSSVSDLAYMETVLAGLDCPYGVFYAEGNHERECRFDPEPYLLRAGVTILADQGIRLENGVNLIGRNNALALSAAQIMETDGLDPAAPTIVFQHRPKGLSQLDGVADLAVCGHTHGYSFPFTGVMMPYIQDISYGHRKYGDTDVVVSAGVAEWGFRTKWPSQSDVTVIHLNFEEANQA